MGPAQSYNQPMPRHTLDLAKLKAEHTPRAIAQRLSMGLKGIYLRDFVYGAIDGTVTTFAIVAAVAGAGLSPGIVVIMGIANLIGDGFSMAVGNYLGTRSEEKRRRHHRKTEEEHIKHYPAGEREEVRQIFAAKGFEGDDLERVVETITGDLDRWVDTMLTEEYGLALDGPKPWKAASVTFLAFVVAGALPLISYVYNIAVPQASRISDPFLISSIVTGLAFFFIGAGKSRFAGERWWLAGLETLLLGGIAAVLAYQIGAMLEPLIPISSP